MSNVIREAFDAVRGGRHASAVLEEVFRVEHPDATRAASLRAELFGAIRAAGMPAWLHARLRKAWGERTQALVDALMHDAPTFVRVNTLRTTTPAAASAMAAHQPARCDLETALRIGQPFGLFRTEAFRNGWFEQQDLASQRVALDLDVRPGMRVVDACAGAGGKTLQMAALMQNRGRIIAIDVVERKLDDLHRRAQRAGVHIVETRHAASTKTVKRLASTADRVLIDAPCSGTGVLRRNPDIMLHVTEPMLDELIIMQAGILRRGAMAVKPGGRVVYATCSLLRSESEDQVRNFLQGHGHFTLIAEHRTMPDMVAEDGMYWAVMERSGNA
ncbi:MAG: RsmB/NOP family class I SAM-dependent RNA methyltransferase [Candidatus Kapabacteria bacterium]|nr:RsmB/NOP family class I SAM-dependent RNA methyltransferase [Candidatus Kapabacteria bacterium]